MINELSEVLRDKASTPQCRAGFRDLLAQFEAQGPDYVTQNLTAIRSQIIELLTASKLTRRPLRTQSISPRIKDLREAISIITPDEAFPLLINARQRLDASVPGNATELDPKRINSIRSRLTGNLSPDQIEQVITAVQTHDQAALINIGRPLDLNIKSIYYLLLMQNLPSDQHMAEKFTECAYYGNMPNFFRNEMSKPENSQFLRRCAEHYAYIVIREAGKRNRRTDYETAMQLLEHFLSSEGNRLLYRDLAHEKQNRWPH